MTGNLYEKLCIYLIIPRQILRRMRSISDESCREKTRFKLNIFLSENRAVYELVWKNMVRQTGHRRQYNMAHALCTLED